MKNRTPRSLQFVFRLVEQFLEPADQEAQEKDFLSRKEIVMLAAMTVLIVAIIVLVFRWISG